MRDIMKFIFLSAVLKISTFEAFCLSCDSFYPSEWTQITRAVFSICLIASWPVAYYLTIKLKRL